MHMHAYLYVYMYIGRMSIALTEVLWEGRGWVWVMRELRQRMQSRNHLLSLGKVALSNSYNGTAASEKSTACQPGQSTSSGRHRSGRYNHDRDAGGSTGDAGADADADTKPGALSLPQLPVLQTNAHIPVMEQAFGQAFVGLGR